MNPFSLIYDWVSFYLSRLWAQVWNSPGTVLLYFVVCSALLLAFNSPERSRRRNLIIIRCLAVVGTVVVFYNDINLVPLFNQWYDIPMNLAIGCLLCLMIWNVVAWCACCNFGTFSGWVRGS